MNDETIETPQAAPKRRSRVLAGVLLIALIFAGGATFWAWASENWFGTSAPAAESADPAQIAELDKAAITVQPGNVAPDHVENSVEERLRDLEVKSQVQQAPENGISSTAQRLVLIISARRAMERGLPHDRIAQALALEFPAQRSVLLAPVLRNASKPASLAALTQEFETLKPQMQSNSGNWFDRLSDLAVIRSKSVEHNDPADLLRRAEEAVRRSDFTTATTLIRQHPSRAISEQWVSRASAFAAAAKALDSLEALALVEPPLPVVVPQPQSPTTLVLPNAPAP